METVCQVALNLLSGEEARRVEKILREYLLRTSDQVSMQRAGSSPLTIFHFGPASVRQLKKLVKPEDIASQDDHQWTFNLTDNVRNLLNQATLYLNGNIFHGFIDPKFLSRGNQLAYLISSEKHLTLYIPDYDKAQLANQGINLDNVSEL